MYVASLDFSQAMPRAYTKSGSIEKYESSQWSTPTWSGGATGSVTGPDSNGNYTVNAPSGYTSGGSTVKCTTKYGGITKDFWFKKSGPIYCNIMGNAIYSNNKIQCGLSISPTLSSNTTTCTWYFNNGQQRSTIVKMDLFNQSFSFNATESVWSTSSSIKSISLAGYKDGDIVNGYTLIISVRH